VDCIEITDELSGMGDCITLFVFSDSLEVFYMSLTTVIILEKTTGLAELLNVTFQKIF
jgi:hypothetical protein